MSVEEDSLPDFFLKFGLITHMINDVSSFKRKMKQAAVVEDGRWRKKRLEGLSGLPVNRSPMGEDKQILLGKGGFKPKDAFKNNHLYKLRAREDGDYMVMILNKITFMCVRLLFIC